MIPVIFQFFDMFQGHGTQGVAASCAGDTGILYPLQFRNSIPLKIDTYGSGNSDDGAGIGFFAAVSGVGLHPDNAAAQGCFPVEDGFFNGQNVKSGIEP